MAWNTPRTARVLQLIDAAFMNEQLRDNMDALSLHTHSGVPGDGSDTIGPLTGIDLIASTSDPATAGELKYVGADLKYFDGTSVINITDHNHST